MGYRTTDDIPGTEDALPKQRALRRSGLTPRSLDVLKAIAALLKVNGYSPSYTEIGEVVNLSSPATIYRHILHLENADLIERSPNCRRSLELTEKGRQKLNEVAA